MDSKIKILLDKVNIGEDYFQYFNDAKISKIKISSKTNKWNIFIDIDKLLPVDVYKELDENKMLLDENAKDITFVFNIKHLDINNLIDYYDYLLELLKDDLKVIELYKDCLRVEDNSLVFVVSTEMEKERISKVISKIEKFYKRLSYNDKIDIIVREDSNIYEEIQ